MAITLQEYLAKDLFLQKATFHTPHTPPIGFYTEPDVVVLKDFVWRWGFVIPSPATKPPPRVIVIEAMAHDPLMRYPSLAQGAGYRMHRCKIFEANDLGEVALIEFHRKETINAE